MLTAKYKNTKIFPSFELSTTRYQGSTPKLSVNKSAINIYKDSNKLDDFKLPSLKFYLNSNDSTNNNSSFDTKQFLLKNNKFDNPLLNRIYSNEKIYKKRFSKRVKVILKKKENNNDIKTLKMNKSTTDIIRNTFKRYKISNDLIFHRKLMENNSKRINNYIKNEMKTPEDSYIKSLEEAPSKKEPKTGIFGPRSNIVNLIRAEMERLKFDNLYKNVKVDIKETIKDELMDAQVKLKRKPEELKYNKKLDRPLYIKKMDRYRYISSINKVRQLNQIANFSVLEQDGNIIKKLSNDAYDAFNNLKNQHT